MRTLIDYAKELAGQIYPDTENRDRTLERKAFVRGFDAASKSAKVDIYFWAIVAAVAGFAVGGLIFIMR